jgi:hypothetical protein
MTHTPTFALLDRLLDSWVAGDDIDVLPDVVAVISHEVEEDMRRERRRWLWCPACETVHVVALPRRVAVR